MKKTRSKKSRDTVPLTRPLWDFYFLTLKHIAYNVDTGQCGMANIKMGTAAYKETRLELNQLHRITTNKLTHTEAEFLNVIGIKVFRVFLLAIHSHLY